MAIPEQDTARASAQSRAEKHAALANVVPRRLPAATLNHAYRAHLKAIGGIGPYTWTISKGELPAGFSLNVDQITCDRVRDDVFADVIVRVTDAEGAQAESATSISSDEPDEAIARVRRSGAFLFDGILLALAAAGMLLVARLLISFEDFLFVQASRLRTAAGIATPASGPDWYIILVLAVGPLICAGAAVVAFTWHRRVWSARVRATWRHAPGARQLARVARIPAKCPRTRPCPHCALKIRYLRALLESKRWTRRWTSLRVSANVGDTAPSTLGLDQYVPVANAVFAELEKDIAERALTTGLLVGVGRSRWFDSLTIAVSAFEMQMFVLSSLGKRPGVRLWWRMLHRCSASLFVNAYLNRQDLFALNLMIKQGAWGLHAAASSTEYVAEHLRDGIQQHRDTVHDHANLLLDHAADFDTHVDASDVDGDEIHHGMSGPVKIAAELAAFSFSTGAVALNQIAVFVEHSSTALLQGALAGGILYWDGCDLAAQVLALNATHRDSAELKRSVLGCASLMARQAGQILQVATRQLRSMYRQRRMRIVRTLVSKQTLERGFGRMVSGIKGLWS